MRQTDFSLIESPPRSLLVIKFSALGDIVQALQVTQTVARQWPACKITWIVHERFAALVQAAPFVHRVITFPRKSRLKAGFRLLQTLQKTSFDLVWDLQGLFRPALCALFAKAPHKWGFRRKKGLWGLPYSHCLTHHAGAELRHAITYLQQFPLHAGIRSDISLPLVLKPTTFFQEPETNDFLSEKKTSRLFIIFTDSSREEKAWKGYDIISQLIWIHLPESRIVWCGLKTTSPPSSPPVGRFLNLQGKCTLEQMITVVRQPSVFIGNDSGPMHLAAAVGNPVLALFGPTSPERFGPWPIGSPNSQIVVAPQGQLANLKAENVFFALQELLERVGQR